MGPFSTTVELKDDISKKNSTPYI